MRRRVDAVRRRAYRSTMNSGRFRRRTIALVAAYAVALQALLLMFVPMAPAGPIGAFAVLCSHDSADGTGQPAQHDLPCAALCAALGHGVSGSLPPGLAVAPAQPLVFMAAVSMDEWTLPRLDRADPHAPRGPPPV